MRKDLAALIVALGAAAAPPTLGQPTAQPWDERALAAPLDHDALAAEIARDGPSRVLAEGERLFRARFTTPDGAGRPLATQAIVPTKRRRPAERAMQRLSGPDASSCVACHIEPLPGGAGDFAANAFVSEGFSSADFDTLDPQFSNERGTNHLFGAGLVELLAREMTAELQAQRRDALRRARETGAPATIRLTAKGVEFGALTAGPDGLLDISALDGVDSDLVIRPFSQKGVIVSLRQFTVNALNAHHGIQAEERFGPRWTGEADFDGDGIGAEIGAGDVTALTLWQASLPPPLRATPEDPLWRDAAAAGEAAFAAFGCAACHIPALPLDGLVFHEPAPGAPAGVLRQGEAATVALDLGALDWAARLPRDAQGRALVPLYGDLKRHVIADPVRPVFGDELLGQRFVARDVFLTAELWGVADTGPYGHRGDLSTLDEAIRAHGGAAAAAAKAYEAAPEDARQSVIAFLRTLRIAP
ncbi:hypothetical protein [Rubrimonas sp.]|uniref:hypothetical protein n=1 Tax=Rubrimonas sp. TaxID=2036015 RepID=UPI002FDE0328